MKNPDTNKKKESRSERPLTKATRKPYKHASGKSISKSRSPLSRKDKNENYTEKFKSARKKAGSTEYSLKTNYSSTNRSPDRQSSLSADGTLRLNRYLSLSGICSRRQADEYIKEGLVSVNDKIITEFGTKVLPGDKVKFNNELITAEKKVYLLLNKPKDFITTAKDNAGRKTVYDLIKGACSERIFPVGRLDRNSMGVLLMTNDGELAVRLSHPKYRKKKIYHVFLDRNLKLSDFEEILKGIKLEDGFIKADDLSFVNPGKKDEIGVEIHSGKNRIVRRIFEHLGYKIIKLDRVYFAGLTKKNLQRGKWRFLSEKEINMLKMNAFE